VKDREKGERWTWAVVHENGSNVELECEKVERVKKKLGK